MAKGEFISFRKRSSEFDASKVLAALKKKKVGKNDSDRLRMGLVLLAHQNDVKVPAA